MRHYSGRGPRLIIWATMVGIVVGAIVAERLVS